MAGLLLFFAGEPFSDALATLAGSGMHDVACSGLVIESRGYLTIVVTSIYAMYKSISKKSQL